MKQIKKEVYKALEILNLHKYKAYIVGGAVRNALLKKEITDYDITTNASPDVIKQLFCNYPLYTIGEKHGTVVITIDKVKIDITTFRKDDNYIDHRHPSEVMFSDDLNQDLKRRDFTINALCLDINDNLIDNFNGLKDLENKTIRSIGNPDVRFNEDALRILRALRFKAKLGFEIEEETKKSLFKNKDLLRYVSNERKKDELLQILASNNAKEVINDFLPIFNTFIPLTYVDEKINNFSNEYYALAYTLSKIDNYDLKCLKFSKQEIDLIETLKEAGQADIKENYDFIILFSDPYSEHILKFLYELRGVDYSSRLKKLKKYIVTINDLKIDGKYLMELGYKGKDIKKIKEELLDLIRRQKIENKENELINYLIRK